MSYPTPHLELKTILFSKSVFTNRNLFVNQIGVPHCVVQTKRQAGFTLLELIVVVAILSIIAGAAVMRFADTGSDAERQATLFSMKQIAQAVEAYYQDNKNDENVFINAGTANRASPADLKFLFENDHLSIDFRSWNPDYRQGWRGPYLKQAQYMYVDIGDDLQLDGSGAPTVIGANFEQEILAIPDAYSHSAVLRGGEYDRYQTCTENIPDGETYDKCLLDWRKVPELTYSPEDFDTIEEYQEKLKSNLLERNGRPYLLIDLQFLNMPGSNAGVTRIVSFGENGVYEPPSCLPSSSCTGHEEYCSSSGDDLVLCLR